MGGVEYQMPPSFVPQKAAVAQAAGQRHARASVWTIVSVGIFVLALLAALAVFAYQRVLARELTDMNANLIAAREAFEPEFIEELARMDRRLGAARALLAGHRSLSPLFVLLEKETLATIRWNQFSFVESPDGARVELEGEAAGFNAVALQSDVFGRNINIRNPIFSDFDVDKTGLVRFRFTATLASEFIRYRAHVGVAGNSARPEIAPTPSPKPLVTPPAPVSAPVEEEGGFGNGNILF